MAYYNLSDFQVQGDANEAEALWEKAQAIEAEFHNKFPRCRCRWQVCNGNRIDRDVRSCNVVSEEH